MIKHICVISQCSSSLHQFDCANDSTELVFISLTAYFLTFPSLQIIVIFPVLEPDTTPFILSCAVQSFTVPFIFSHPHLHLSPPPHAPHASLFLSLHHSPSLVFFFCQPSRAFLTFAFHRPFILHANHFPLPLPCLPALSPAHCCSRSFCSFSSFPRSTIGGIDSLCSIITVPPKDQQHKSTAASLLRPDAMLNLIKGGNINDSIFLREVWMERIVSYCLVDSAVTFCRFESSLVGVARAFFLFDSSWASFWKNFFWRSQRCKNLKAEHDGVG